MVMIVMMMVMIIIMMMVMVVIMVMMVVVVMMVLRHYNRFLVGGSGIALVLSAQNLLGVGNWVQQLGKRLGGF